ncbi:MAG: MFS transporter [Clostridia bacterium]
MNEAELTDSKMLAKDAKLMLVLNGLFAFSVTLSNVFVNTYLWKIGTNFRDVAMYNLMNYVMIAITFTFAGWLMGKWGRTRIFQLGVVLNALFFLYILYLQEDAVQNVWQAGMLQGIASGFYWMACNVLFLDVTHQRNRDYFFGLNGFLTSGAGILAPLLSGYVIGLYHDLSGYQIVFLVSLLLFCAVAVASFWIDKHKYPSEYRLVEALVESVRCRPWKMAMLATFAFGMREGIFAFIVFLLVYIATGSEVSLGWFAALISAVGMAAYYGVGKWIATGTRNRMLVIGTMVLVAASFVLALDINRYTLLIFGLLNAIFTPFFIVPFNTNIYNAMTRAHSQQLSQARTEYMVVRELALNAGRVLSVGAFMLFFDGSNLFMLKLVLIAASLALIASCWFMNGFGRETAPASEE